MLHGINTQLAVSNEAAQKPIKENESPSGISIMGAIADWINAIYGAASRCINVRPSKLLLGSYPPTT